MGNSMAQASTWQFAAAQKLYGTVKMVRREFAEAFQWLTLAAAQGDIAAQGAMAKMFSVKSSPFKALYWAKLAQKPRSALAGLPSLTSETTEKSSLDIARNGKYCGTNHIQADCQSRT
jgi:TPR repeat protein